MLHSFPRILAACCLLVMALAGTAPAQQRHVPAGRATSNLDELVRRPGTHTAETEVVHEADRPWRFRKLRTAATGSAAAVRQPRASEVPPAAAATMKPAYTGFPSLVDNFTAIPPDTMGTVGRSDVVTMLNTQVLIQSRAGVTRSGYPVSLNAFWQPLGTFRDTFDPRILYDAANDRWIASSVVNGQSSSSALLVAVTQSGDPGGIWNMWKVDLGSAGNWGDYDILGFNGNWVTVSLNLFNISKDTYVSTNLYVFNKADLYNKNGTGAYVTFADRSGEFTPVQDFDSHPNSMYFVQAYAADPTIPGDFAAIRISRLDGPPGSEKFVGGNGGEIDITADAWGDSGPTDSAGDSVDFAPQFGTATKIDAGDSRLQNCAMRGGTIWCAHTIFLPVATPTRSAVQWFQLDPAQRQIVQRGRIDDPSGTNFYAYPSIAVNRNNDVLVGYNRFSSSDYPSAEFSFRLATDPATTMQPETMFKHGEASYVSVGARSGSNRWGDYSATMVDPADDLTFWTIQEYAGTPDARHSGAFGTWWAVVAAPSVTSNCAFTLSQTNLPFGGTGGTGTISVTTSAGCPWMAASNNPWITVNPGTLGNGSGTVQFNVAAAPDPSTPRSGTVTVAGQIVTIAQGTTVQPPLLPSNGLVNAASYAGGGVAPGEIVTIYGTSLGPTVLAQPSVTANVVGTVAGGTRVLFDGAPVAMIYALGGQVSAVAPFTVQGRASVQIQVEYQGTLSKAITLPVVATAPGIFTMNTQGTGQGAILNSNYTVNSAANPAARNDFIQIYATGGGVIPGAVDNTLAKSGALDLSKVSARIGGLPANVSYAGVAPGLTVGALQLNVQVPAGVAPGSAAPVDITIGGVTSQTVTMAVR